MPHDSDLTLTASPVTGAIQNMQSYLKTPTGCSRYARSCGLLLLPAIAWNLAFTSTLMPPPAMAEFWRDIPASLVFIENVLRALVFGLPFAMPLHIATKPAWRALLIFVLGTLVYFASWLALMVWPDSAWSTSALGSLAPAYTPVLFLPSLAVLGTRLFWGRFWGRFYRRWMYLLVCVGFLSAHITHAAIMHMRSSQRAVDGAARSDKHCPNCGGEAFMGSQNN